MNYQGVALRLGPTLYTELKGFAEEMGDSVVGLILSQGVVSKHRVLVKVPELHRSDVALTMELLQENIKDGHYLPFVKSAIIKGCQQHINVLRGSKEVDRDS